MSEVVHIPQLRFSEFSGEWEEKPYGENYRFLITNSFSRDKLNYDFGEVKNIHYGDIHTKFKTLFDMSIETVPFINDDVDISRIDNDNYCQVGDLVVADASEDYGDIGKTIEIVNLDLKKTLAGLHTFLVRPMGNSISIGFMGNLLKSWKVRKQVMTVAQGSKVLGLSKTNLSKIKISLPTKPEQQKIAAFLTEVDNKIEQLSKKQELLGEYKKGAMQQIFSQATRFKADDGSNFPDWEEVKLGNLTHKVGKKNKENIKYPIYSINNQEGFRPQSEQFDGLDSNDRGYDISLYKIVNEKTFAYNPARINVGSIGYSYNLNKVIVSSLYVCFKTNDELEDLYLLAYLDTDKFNKDILRYEEGGVRQYLFYENFSQISIPLPGNDEQAKISNFLSSIDNKIEQVDKQLDESKQFKKALLQQMFV